MISQPEMKTVPVRSLLRFPAASVATMVQSTLPGAKLPILADQLLPPLGDIAADPAGMLSDAGQVSLTLATPTASVTFATTVLTFGWQEGE
jgi:hypothetical protein